MKLFNALQVVMLYGAMPFILVWLSSDPAPFQYANAAWYVACAMYLGLFGWITYMVFYYFEKDTRKAKSSSCTLSYSCPRCSK